MIVVRTQFRLPFGGGGADLPAYHTATESMHRIKETGREIKKALEAGDLPLFGRLMHGHWLEKKRGGRL